MTVVACDVDKTCSAHPEFYKAELAGLMKSGHTVHMLSGSSTAQQTLDKLGFQKGIHYSHVAVVPHKGIAKNKVEYMKGVGATHLIDDRKKNCKAAKKAGFAAHRCMNPDK